MHTIKQILHCGNILERFFVQTIAILEEMVTVKSSTYDKPVYMEKRMESIKIKGMSCQHCVGSVLEALEKIPGLSQVTVNLDRREATFDNKNVSRENIRAAISKIGFEPGE